MKQVLKTIKKELTVEQISPLWAIVLHQVPRTSQSIFYRKGRRLDIRDCKKCIVAEAYKFTSDYDDFHSKSCDGCWKRAIDFAYVLGLPLWERKQMVQDFVSHWNKAHIT